MAVLGIEERYAHAVGIAVGAESLECTRPIGISIFKSKDSGSFDFKRFIVAFIFLLFPFFSTPTVAQTGYSVGALKGSFEVSGSGQATYNIPITVPPGINGVVPKLSLSYSSGGANGFTGVGGSLSGFSAITRCASTIAQEGQVGGVNHDSNDRFCLGGQKLIAINGAYGAIGTEYRTEIESFQKIISNGSIAYPGGGAGPESFTVHTRTGGVVYYGATADARIAHPTTGVVHRWWISQLQDAKGNAIDYQYSDHTALNSDGVSAIERLPLQIHYGRNDSQLVAGDVDVKLVYETRPDPVYSYGNGMAFKLTQRLTHIQTYVANVLVRDYRIGYDQDPIANYSRMISAQDCAPIDVCTPPTTFAWHDVTIGWTPHSSIPPDDLISASGGARGTLVDLNNDGWTDWITAVRNSDGTESKTAWLNGPSGWTTNVGYTPPGVLFDYTGSSVGAAVGQVIDLNSDGKPDWVNAYTTVSGTINSAWLNTGSGWARAINFDLPVVLVDSSQNAQGEGYASFIDLNGDALVDITVSTRPQLGVATVNAWLNTGSGWQQDINYAPPEIQVDYNGNSHGIHRGRYVDIDADGLPDWITAVKNANGLEDYSTWLNTGSGWLQDNSLNVPKAFLSYAVNPKGNPISDLVDVNGDGLADLVQAYEASNNIQVKNTWLFTGTAWLPSIPLTPPGVGAKFNIDNSVDGRGSFLDLNADGLADFVESYQSIGGSAVNNVWRNTGVGWVQDNSLNLPAALTRHRSNQDSVPRGSLGEVNGDGDIDLIIAAAGTNGGSAIYVSAGNGASPAAIHTVTNGLGFINKVEYATRLDQGVYVAGTDGGYPDIDNAGPITLVSASEAIDGVGGWARSEHTYGRSKLNLLGRGSLGFAFHDVLDTRTGIKLHNNYLQSFPHIGAVANSNKTLANGTVIHQSSSTYASIALNFGKTVFPYSNSKQTDTFELDGSAFASATTTLVYDNFGNVTQSTSSTSDLTGVYTKTLNHTYTNDTTAWLLGLKTASSATHSAPGQITPLIRNTSTSYAANGFIANQTIEPGNANAVTTSYSYDGFGHAIQTTVSAVGVTARSSSVTYSPDGKFPISATNAIGHSASKEYDARFGVVTRAVDVNNQVTIWLYDEFGAEIKKTDVRGLVDTGTLGDDGKEVTVLKWCTEAGSNCPANAVYFASAVDNQNESPESVYFDVFGRTVRKQSFGFVYNPDPLAAPPPAPVVYADTEYDAFGKKHKVSLPYFEGDIPLWTTVLYDVLGRPISNTAPNGATTTFAYQGRTTSVTNVLNQTNTKTVNAQGKPVTSIDAMGNQTQYVYNALGHLLQTIDPLGNIVSIDYDLFGRKIAMNDPDMGSWTYEYNALGNLTGQTDAKGQVVTIEYDLLNRKTRRVEPEGETLWAYDSAANGLGKLASVSFTKAGSTTNSYHREYQYDDFGRLTHTSVTQNGAVYVTESGYQGTTDRLDWVFYPSNLMVRKAYDAYGFPTEIRSNGLASPQAYQDQDLLAQGLEADALQLQTDLQPQIDAEVAAYNQAIALAEPIANEARALANQANHYASLYTTVANQANSLMKSADRHYKKHRQAIKKADEQERLALDYEQKAQANPGNGEYAALAAQAWANRNMFVDEANREGRWANSRQKAARKLIPKMDSHLASANAYSQQANAKAQQANIHYATATTHADAANALNDQVQKAIDLANEARALATKFYDEYFNQNSNLHWQALEVAANGQVVKSVHGNGVTTSHGIEASTGRILSILAENDPNSIGNPYLSDEEVTRLLANIQGLITEFDQELMGYVLKARDSETQSNRATADAQAAADQAAFFRQLNSIGEALLAEAEAADFDAEANLHDVNSRLNQGLADIHANTVQVLASLQAAYNAAAPTAASGRQLEMNFEQALADHYRAIEILYQTLSSQQAQVSTTYTQASAPAQTELDALTTLASYQSSISSSYASNSAALSAMVESAATQTNSVQTISANIVIETRAKANIATLLNSRAKGYEHLSGAMLKAYANVDATRSQMAALQTANGNATSASYFTDQSTMAALRVAYLDNIAIHYRTQASITQSEDEADPQSWVAAYGELASLMAAGSESHTQTYEELVAMADPIWWTQQNADFNAEVVDLTTLYDGLAIQNALLASKHQANASAAADALAHALLISTSGKIQDLGYAYDSLGNLLSRTDNAVDLHETFNHDNLNRLTQSTLTGAGAAMYVMVGLDSVSYSYDPLGNITSKTDVGSYIYGAGLAGPHAVTSVTGLIDATYSYDANGNQISGNGRTVAWSSFDKPTQVINNGVTTSMTYGPERQLIETSVDTGVSLKTTVYVGSIYEKITTGASIEERHHITLNGKAVAVINKRSASDIETHYLHRDHLGSITAITDEHGYLVERFHYDAFGERRKAVVAGDPLGNTIDTITDRGYTGHKQLSSAGLIHMGGRVYDAMLGRFLSADPHIQSPLFSQSFNRYSYVWNNPLSLTDPSGYFSFNPFKKLKKLFKKIKNIVKKVVKKVVSFVKKYWRQIAVVVIMIYAPYLLTTFTALGPVAAGAIAGGLAGYVSTGSLKGAVIGAAAGAALGAIGAYYDPISASPGGLTATQSVTKSGLHGVVGGARSELSGGTFKSGFLSGAVPDAFGNAGGYKAIGIKSNPSNFGDRFHNAVAAGAVGGATSEIAGGSFKNGFYNGAAGRLLNDLGWDPGGDDPIDANGKAPVAEGKDWTFGDPFADWFVDGATGFGDTFGAGYIRSQFDIDGGINHESGYYLGGQIAGTVTPGLGTAAVLRGSAYLGGTKAFHYLNHNRYLRLGPGRMPRNGNLPAGREVPRMSVGKGPRNPHFDLRVRPLD